MIKIWILIIGEFDTDTYYDVEIHTMPFTSLELAKQYAQGYIDRWCIPKYDLPDDYLIVWDDGGAPDEGMFSLTLVREKDETGHDFWISAKELDAIYGLTVIQTI